MTNAPASTSPPVVLSFAATDPSGGAGVTADILTLASMGCHPLTVVTAIGVQDTRDTEAMLPMDPDWVADQARCLLEDMVVDAFKVGALGSVENAAAIAEILADYPDVPLILDPVHASGHGDDPAQEDLLRVLRELLLPRALVVVPNGLELRRLAEIEDVDEPTLAQCAERLLESGVDYVLATGTHEPTKDIVNTLFARGSVVRTDSWQRLAGGFHGAGSTLAAAIAALVAGGVALAEAVGEAQEYTWQCLNRAYRPGMGFLLPDRMFWAREDDDPPVDDAAQLRPRDARSSH
jgi:hydroxymethylpyrimidine/phosphomethylpyrimidine kinase